MAQESFKNTGIATKLVHSGEVEDGSFHSVVTPIYRSTTYRLNEEVYSLVKKYGRTEDPEGGIGDEELRALRDHIFYARDGIPNAAAVQKKMAVLEDCDDAVAASSGMGAISSTLLSLVQGKRFIVSTPHLYGATFSFIFRELHEMFGIKVISLEDFLSGRKAVGREIMAIYVETLSNPFLVIPPLDAIRELRDERYPEVPIIVDNTFLTPVNFRPFTLLDSRRDIVLYSVTKYLAGHSDVTGGMVCGGVSKINKVWEKMVLYGCNPDGESAYYLERGLKTLHLRMERHNQNMYEVYKYLVDVSDKFKVKIFHPLNAGHEIPQFARPLLEDRKLGGMITFNIEGKEERDGIRFMETLHRSGVIKHATSLGGVESLISMPYNMSQPSWAQQEMLGLKRFQCLLRLSVGIEDAADIIGTLDRAFNEMF